MTTVWVIAVHLDVAGDVFYGVSLYYLFFPRDVLDGILDLIESVSKGVPTYSWENHGVSQVSL